VTLIHRFLAFEMKFYDFNGVCGVIIGIGIVNIGVGKRIKT
jgi:hypothetical protein